MVTKDEPHILRAPTLRPAVPGDASVLSAIAVRAKAHWGYSAEYMVSWAEQLAVAPEFIEAHPVWVAVLDGAIVGFGALTGGGDHVELEHLWVEPSCIRRGVGRRLLEHLAVTARDGGANRLRIVSDPNAEGFYLRMGAQKVAEKDSSIPGRRLPVLELVLGAR